MILEQLIDERGRIFYGHTDKVTITILLNEETFEFARFNNMDEIENYPNAKHILIAGLKQKDFEKFVSKYADKFDVIHFWKCPYVADLSVLGDLRNVKYITYFWNRNANKLWDFSKNDNLVGFMFESFSKVKTLDGIEKLKSLKELWFNRGHINDKYEIETLWPLTKCPTLESLWIILKKIIDNDHTALLKIKSLKELSFSERLFTTEQIAMLKANLKNVKSDVLAPYYYIEGFEDEKNTIIMGEGKPFLNFQKDASRIENYKRRFEEMVEQFRNMQK